MFILLGKIIIRKEATKDTSLGKVADLCDSYLILNIP